MSNPDDYAREVTKQAIARACVALGFKNAQPAVLDALADIIRHYIQHVSEKSVTTAELSGRVQPGIQDVLQVLDAMVSLASILEVGRVIP